jgi:hypothetical protein
MPRVNYAPDVRGSVVVELNLAEWTAAGTSDEAIIQCAGWDSCTIHTVQSSPLTWGTTIIEVQRSNDGVNRGDFSTPITDISAVGFSALISVEAIGYLHLAVATAAGTGKVKLHVQFHKAG